MKNKRIGWLMMSLMSVGLSALPFSVSAAEGQGTIESSEAMEQVRRSINSLELKQAAIKKNYFHLYDSLSARDSVLRSTLAYLDGRMAMLQDSIDTMNAELAASVADADRKSEAAEEKLNVLTAINYIAIGILIILLSLTAVVLARLKRTNAPARHDETARDEASRHDYEAALRRYEDMLRRYSEKMDSSEVSLKSALDGLNQVMAREKDALTLTNGSLSQAASDLKSSIDKALSDLDGRISIIKEMVQEMEAKKEIAESSVNDGHSAGEHEAVTFRKPDKVAYDSAVNTWININDHLYSLGKDRKRIPHVYALLAGQDTDEKDLQKDLSSLSEERRESVSAIISDINRFKAVHLPVIEEWISAEYQKSSKIRDVVRYPLNQGFDNGLDEELTGDSVSDGTPVAMVASLGYMFPGSLNGSYRVKAKVLV